MIFLAFIIYLFFFCLIRKHWKGKYVLLWHRQGQPLFKFYLILNKILIIYTRSKIQSAPESVKNRISLFLSHVLFIYLLI
jgi:hypothetical protein